MFNYQKDFKGKRVTIMGLGLQGSGVAVVSFFLKKKAKITVTDLKTKDQLRESLDKLAKYKEVKYVLGQHRSEDFINTDLIIKGPGVPWSSKYLEIAKKNKVSIDSETGIFFALVKNPVIGITGTRGKTTTTHLINAILKEGKKHSLMGGNMKGRPLLEILEMAKKSDVFFVLELSSFQLEGLRVIKKSPQISVITNFMKDHLDRYSSLEDYYQAKSNILKYQGPSDFAVLNYDDERVKALSSFVKGGFWFFSQKRIGGSNVVFCSEKKIWVRKNNQEKEILSLQDVNIIGKHRIANVLASVAVAQILEIPNNCIVNAVRNFTGVEHRLEEVKEINKILYVNDTTATVPEATMEALRSFESRPIILIVGGADKKLDFTCLAEEIVKNNNIKEIIFLEGKGTERLVSAIKKHLPEKALDDFSFEIKNNLEDAIFLAKDRAESGDVVLLSPGCSSFGMFQNEFDRGDQFKKIVNNLL